jgi:bacterial/archaeal transporter family protein
MWNYVFASFFLFGFAHFYRKQALKGVDPFVAGFLETISQLLIAWAALAAFSSFPSTIPAESVAAGFALFLATACIFLALRKGLASAVSAIINLNALVSVPLAVLFLGEELSLRAAAGIALAVFVIPLLKSPRFKDGGWLKYSVAAMILLGVFNHLNAFASRGVGAFAAYAVLMTSSAAFYSAFVLLKKRKELSSLQLPSIKRLAFSGLVLATATLCMFKAYSLGAASVVVPVVNMNLLVTAVLSTLAYKEKLGVRGWLAVALAASSVWLLAG